MIKGITAGPGLTMTGGTANYQYITPNTNNPLTGMIRVNNSDLQVFDGNMWQNLAASYPSVGLDQDTQDLLQWARTQRQLEQNRVTLVKNNPALQKAYEAVLRAEENFDLLATIAGEEESGIVVGYNFNTP